MLAAERRDYLLERLQRDGTIVAKQIAAELGLADDSIRKDLRELAAEGLLQRVYGGALPVSPALADYATRQSIAPESKQRVARAAAALIREGSTVLIDGGSTALALAHVLPPSLRATTVTHSPTVAAALAQHPSVDVIMLGGRIFKHSVVASGAALVEAASRVRADQFFVGVTGVHDEAGLTTGDLDEAAVKRALADRAADVYVLASREKVGAASAFDVLSFDQIAGVITDAEPEHPVLQRLARRGVAIIPA
ncbi:DeoR/GlpR family DNA-binding transcription regulator [Microcella humidisoli]|uniref:Lactose phosphotransferase system repressor n=1 Tax=Microcella humidisoli TaxID=2963406 RepID=A0ABY5FZ39_9MICO|nr:DeoR/GlpR family DNA-binding transcription regulator [Microcella humidisoli]UTT63593.1 DeoR/GlpR family DNA-binding transcription regulator [Microcella humidisoli]